MLPLAISRMHRSLVAHPQSRMDLVRTFFEPPSNSSPSQESQCILSAKALACDYMTALGSGQTSDEEQTQACTPRLRLSLPAFELCMLAVLGACILFIRARTRI